jgi:hypothetical protein
MDVSPPAASPLDTNDSSGSGNASMNITE